MPMVNGLNASNFFDYVGLRISNCSGLYRRPTEFVRFDSQDFFGSRNHRCAFRVFAWYNADVAGQRFPIVEPQRIPEL